MDPHDIFSSECQLPVDLDIDEDEAGFQVECLATRCNQCLLVDIADAHDHHAFQPSFACKEVESKEEEVLGTCQSFGTCQAKTEARGVASTNVRLTCLGEAKTLADRVEQDWKKLGIQGHKRI